MSVSSELEKALSVMRGVEGWFNDEEGSLMFESVREALASGLKGQVVEIGSYCGRSTVILGTAVRQARVGCRVLAIDPHEGGLSVPGVGNSHVAPTLVKFRETMRSAGVQECVQEVLQKSFEVKVSFPISVLFIDGLHDFDNVARDYWHFASSLVDGALVMFHDYGNPDFPNVAHFVDTLLKVGTLTDKKTAFHLCVTRKAPATKSEPVGLGTRLKRMLPGTSGGK